MNIRLFHGFSYVVILLGIMHIYPVNFIPEEQIDFAEMPVESARKRLGGDKLIHAVNKYDESLALKGEQLITKGFVESNGKKTSAISKIFLCTDCHNLKREFADVTSEKPSDRMDYAMSNNLYLKSGSTFWGIYNRTSFFNDDYVKKYGKVLHKTNDTLVNAIKFCARYCASGRDLEEWEANAIMHYFKKIELKLKDLNLSDDLLAAISGSDKLSAAAKQKALIELENSYRKKYSATFLNFIQPKYRKYGVKGDSKKGEFIYQKACMFCHYERKLSELKLDKSTFVLKALWKDIRRNDKHSVYNIVRKGTSNNNEAKVYMPLLTKEKLSDSQLEDLVAFIKKMSGNQE